MALGTNHLSNGAGSIAEFIPEVWSDDTIAAYKSNLVVGNLVSKMNHNKKRGDTIHIPTPTRGTANAKVVGSQVTLNENNSSEVQISLNNHWEYSIVIEDIIGIQSLPSLRRFHTDDAGYALATRVDHELFVLAASLQGAAAISAENAWNTAVIGGDGSTAFNEGTGANGNGSTLTDAAIRKMTQTLDDTDTPFSNRYLVIPPIEKNTLMGLSRFTEQAFTGEMGSGNVIRNGRLGDIYGTEVFVSTACPWIHNNSVTGTTSTDFSGTSPTAAAYVDELAMTVDWSTSTPADQQYRAGMLIHRDCLVHASQLSPRSQAQYKQEYLGTLFTSDTIFGVGELRDTAGIAFIVPA